jgi:hypothetical protein
MTTPTTLYLCLDLNPTEPEHYNDISDADLFAATSCAPVLLHPAVATDRWRRNWQAFADRAEAEAYARAEGSIIVIPMATVTVPLEDMPDADTPTTLEP